MITLDATQSNASYLWSGGSSNSTLDVNQSGSYWVDVTVNGCTGSDTINVLVNNNLSIDLGNDTSICTGNTLLLDVSSITGTYVWQDGSTNSTLTATQPGEYWVEVTSGTCSGSDTIVITETTLEIAMYTNNTLSCQAPHEAQFIGEVATNSSGNLTWLWNFGDGGTSNLQSPSHNYLVTGNYSVSLSVTTDNGCVATLANPNWIEVLTGPIANFTFSPYSPTTFESEVSFTNLSFGETSRSWDFGDGNTSTEENPNNEFPNAQGNYTVTLTVYDNFGCADSTSRSIYLEDIIIFYVPNSFTPNSDEHNNDFGPVITYGIDISDFQFTLFNRWGEIVFESSDANGRWDGTYLGKPVQSGTYTWTLEFQELNTDKRQVVSGHVNLLR
jgi:gliding motility-associated-like protein